MNQSLAAFLAGAGVVVMMTGPVFAQGKSQEDHGNSGKNKPPAGNNGNSEKGSNGSANGSDSRAAFTATPPSQIVLAAPTSVSSTTPATPFAWMDNASLMTPGAVWVGVSMVHWRGGGLSELNVPVVDAAIGLTSRLQVGVSVPRVNGSTGNGELEAQEGGVGTTFLNGKIAILNDAERPLKIAVTPTLEILGQTTLQWMPSGYRRVHWGLPASVQVDRGVSRVYGSTGYFSPGVWYAGAGAGTQIGSRIGLSVSFSRAWTAPSLDDAFAVAPKRHDLSTGISADVMPNVGVFGSVARTIRTDPQYGAGTTISVGVSLTGWTPFTSADQ